jgi:outer membrane protein assembly factor BamB
MSRRRHSKLLILATIAISQSIGRAFALDWPQFRGPTGDGVSQASDVPLHWSATEHVAWKQKIPGAGWSSPVLVNDRIYLTTAVTEADDAVSLRVLCLHARDGSINWDVEALRPEATAAKEVHTKNSMASPTPVVHDDRLYVHFGHMGTAALDLDGNIIWTQTELKYSPRHGNGGSPIVVDDLLVFSCDAYDNPFVAALDVATGDVRWKRKRETTAERKFSFSTPIVVEVNGAKQIISAGSGFVGAYDPADGREIWRVSYGEGYSVVPRPVFAHGLIFVATGFENATLLAIDPNGAAGDVTDSHVKWKHEKGAPLTPSPLVVGGELYFISDNGVASCLDARSGKVHWTKRLGGNFSASPVSGAGRVYFLSEEGVTHVVAADKSFQPLAVNDIEESTLASIAVTDNVLFLRSESHLWRVE